MRAVIQRVSRASVTIDGAVVGKIGRGLLVLLGVAEGDDEAAADYLAEKTTGLRIFEKNSGEDDAGKMNFSVADVSGADRRSLLREVTLGQETRRREQSSRGHASRRSDVGVTVLAGTK